MGNRLALGAVHVSDDNRSTLFGKTQDNAAANPAARAGDNDDMIFQAHRSDSSS
jgi:hypothetical protein